jgi:hypothetical protein
MVMAGAVVLAWPDAATLLPTALATAAVMLVVAIWFAIPAAHVPAGVALAAGWLVAFYLLRGDIGWTLVDSTAMTSSLLSATSGHVLAPLTALFGGLAWWLRSTKRDEESRMYGVVAAIVAAVSLGLALWFGFARAGDPSGVTWLLALYALAAFGAGLLLDRANLTQIGSALLLAALVQAIVYRYGDMLRLEPPWIAALLAHSTLTMIGAAALRLLRRLKRAEVQQALIWSAEVTSLAAAVWMAATVHLSSSVAICVALAWLAILWMMLSVLGSWQGLFAASQVALVLGVFCGVTSGVETRAWYTAATHPWLDPWFLEAQGIALAGYVMAVATFREVLTQSAKRQSQYVIEPPTPAWRSAGEELLNPRRLAIDHVVQCGIVALLLIVATYAAAPGAAQELSPTEAAGARVVPPIEQFEVSAVPHAHAAGDGAWMMLAAVALPLASGLRQGDQRWRLAGLLVVSMAVCLLLAARWEADVAVASALRWLTAGAFAMLSTPIWWRKHDLQPRRELRDLLVALVVLIYVALGAYLCQTALRQSSFASDAGQMWTWAFAWAALAGVAGFFARYATRPSPQPNTDAGRQSASAWALHARDVLVLLALGPLLVLFAFTVAKALDARPIVGPEPGSWFQRVGLDVSYGVPLVVIALVLVGHAVRDRSSHFAFAAGLLFNVVATIVVLWRSARGGGVLDALAWVRVAQVNAVVAGSVAIGWLAAVTRGRRVMARAKPQAVGEDRWPVLLVTQVAFAAALCGTFLVPAAVQLAFEPDLPATWLSQAGTMTGWIAPVGAAIAAGWLNWRHRIPQPVVAYFTAALVAIIALVCLRWDTGNWLAYHVLLSGVVAAAWLVPLLTLAINRRVGDGGEIVISWSAVSARLFAVVAVALALRGLVGDPQAPRWTVAALVAISVRNLWIAWREGGRASLWIAAVLANVAASAWWADAAGRLSSTRGPGQPVEFLWVNAIALAVVAIVSAWIERKSRVQRLTQPRGMAFHRFAVWAVVAALLLMTIGGLLDDLSGSFFQTSMALEWLTWLAGVAAAVACLWDPAVRWPVACLYLYGLVAVGIFLGRLDLQPSLFHWALAIALSAYSLVTSALWSVRDRLRGVASRLGVPLAGDAKPPLGRELGAERQAVGEPGPTYAGGGHGWLVTVNFLIGVFVLLLVAWVEQTMSVFTQRMVAAYAVAAQAFAIGLLARGAMRTSLQYLALAWGVFFATAFGWAWLPPSIPAPWLHRLVVTVVALAVVVVIYGFGLVKFFNRENEWTRAAARLVPALAALAAGLIFLALGIEVSAYAETGGVPITWPALVAVALALAGLTFGALAAALLPGRDPLGLSERGRTVYVYAAEALIALLCVHIRVTMPWLFQGWFQQFWPLVVMGIAFIGVGFGELFERRRQRVLSEPLQATGSLLPLLPAVGFWAMSSRVDYSLVLLSIGVLYAALSVLRRSLLYGVLAALAANGSLWYLLSQREGLSLAEHPQLWLIPPALCALVAGYINRERLTQQQSAGLRYAAAIVIYVSSTADVFINGVAEAPWLPAVLAGISIAGVLAGIMLRVRAFLYLGTAFLVVALMTIIWHAAVHQERTWILWIAGIVTGVLIIALFGLFEKRRDDVLRVVEELRHWQA